MKKSHSTTHTHHTGPTPRTKTDKRATSAAPEIRTTARLTDRAHAPPEPNQSLSQALSDERRREELARLLPLWPNERADLTLAGRRHIVRTLERALRAERCRGQAGHWAYDLARHAALLQNLRAEAAALQAAEQTSAAAQKAKRPPEGGRGRP